MKKIIKVMEKIRELSTNTCTRCNLVQVELSRNLLNEMLAFYEGLKISQEQKKINYLGVEIIILEENDIFREI